MSVKGQSAAERQACDQQQRVMDDFEAELLADLEEVDHQDILRLNCWHVPLLSMQSVNSTICGRTRMAKNSSLANGIRTRHLAPRTFPKQLGTGRLVCWGNFQQRWCCECLASCQLRIWLFLPKLVGTWLS